MIVTASISSVPSAIATSTLGSGTTKDNDDNLNLGENRCNWAFFEIRKAPISPNVIDISTNNRINWKAGDIKKLTTATEAMISWKLNLPD
jgi:hypothetical protein